MINNVKYSATGIASVVGGTLISNDTVVRSISINSKEKSENGHCFFAIKGENFNGEDYVDEAISNGAKIIVSQYKNRYSVPTIYVQDTKKALGLLAKHHVKNKKIIGITGSYGKTTVKDMIISVLKEKYTVVGTRENQNNEIGVPLTLLSVQNEDFCVVEMGMRAKGEIEWLSYIAEPEMAIITSSGTSHIERLGSKENIFMAKTEILKYTKDFAILPNTRDFCELDCKKLKKILVGNNTECCVSEIEQTNEELKFKINGKEFLIRSTLSHNAQNALFAYAVGKNYGLTDEEVKKGLMNWKQHENRGGLFFYKGIKIISDCYNASYESVIGAISSLSQQGNNGCKIAVLLGDMLELGENAKAFHYSVGAYCKQMKIDKLFAFGKYAQEYLDGFGGGRKLSDMSLLIDCIMKELLAGDVLLVKASHAVGFEKIIEGMREDK